MLYQLYNGLTIEISVDLYLRMNDVDINELAMSGGGFYACSVNQYGIDKDLCKYDDSIEDRDNSVIEKYLDINGELPSNVIIVDDEEDEYIDDYYDYDD